MSSSSDDGVLDCSMGEAGFSVMEKCGRTCSPLWTGGGLRKGRGVVASAPSFFGSSSVIGMVVPICTSLWQVTADEYGTASLFLGETTFVGLSCKREMDKLLQEC